MLKLSTQAQEVDRCINRLTEAQLTKVFLSRPSSQQIIEALYQGSSVQQAAQTASVPASVARKVLAVLQKHKPVVNNGIILRQCISHNII